MHSRIQKSPLPRPLHRSNAKPNGFILLEVLVAMSLVASAWVGLSTIYQGMILRLGQLQEKRVELRKEIDRHELVILTAAQRNNSSPTSGKLVDESIGMSRRSHPLSGPSRATH